MTLTATGSQTVGPFFHVGLRPLFTHHLAEPGVEGQISIRGRMLDCDGAGVPDAIIEVWQADATGHYPTRDSPCRGFTGFGRVPTDDTGGFVFTTIKPGRVAGPDGLLQAPHISVTIFMRGLLRHLNSRIYFPGEPSNAEDRVLGLVEPARVATLVGRAVEGEPHVIEWDVVLQGVNETVFFEVLMTDDSPGLLDPLFRAEAVRELFSDTARLQGMLDFEAALARAEAIVGVVPTQAAQTIVEHCRAELFDRAQLAADAARAGNLAIPLVAALTRAVSESNREAAGWVHWGATSQDAIDTGLVLQMRHAVQILLPNADRLSDALADLARTHASTPMVGRTWLQHAVPITFGLKVAGWCAATDCARANMSRAGRAASVLQFGGAAGSMAALGDRGLEVTAALAADLSLVVPELPWHAHRDRLVDLGASLGLLIGTLGKIGRDMSLLMQTELGEVAEPAAPGRGGSSAMPHKRNPVACAVMLAAATRAPGLVATLLAAMPQEHERGLGGWHAEWETLPELFLLGSGALSHAVDAIRGLEVDADRMRTNIDMTRGLVMAEGVMMALAPNIGRQQAHQIVEDASRSALSEKAHVRDVLARNPLVSRYLTPQALDALFTTDSHAAQAGRLVDRMLDARRATGKS